MKLVLSKILLITIAYAAIADAHASTQQTIRQKILSFTQDTAYETKEFAKIVGLTVGAGAIYGILHDQVTSRICLQYFSRGFHQEMVNCWPATGIVGTLKHILQTTESPTITGCIWGTIATFELACYSGLVLAIASRLGKKDKQKARDLVKPTKIIMALTGACSALALLDKAHLGRDGYLAYNVSKDELGNFARCLSAHQTAYMVAPCAVIGTALWILAKRLKEAPEPEESCEDKNTLTPCEGITCN